MLESCFVLARQGKTDSKLIDYMRATWQSRTQIASALRAHFGTASDLDEEIASWWTNVGTTTGSSRRVSHKMRNSEDQQIGILLIELESNKDAMAKLGRAVVPYLEISDPILSATVEKAVSGYDAIAQIARRLGRMRKLTPTGLKGITDDYNPSKHELLGGHRAGVRRIVVVRDGIEKDFDGKQKTIVKPWVQAEE